MESFFALLQRNVLDRQQWATRAELRLAIVTWIERTYHRRRRQRALGKLTPIEFELLHHRRNRGLTSTPPESTELGAVPRAIGTLRHALGIQPDQDGDNTNPRP